MAGFQLPEGEIRPEPLHPDPELPLIRLSIILPTLGRPTLPFAVESVRPQLLHGDEVIIVRDDTGDAGNSPRDRAKPSGTHIWYLDDDDLATPDALKHMRVMASKDPKALCLFQMKMPDGSVLWRERAVKPGNVGTSMVLVPNTGDLPRWAEGNDDVLFSDGRWIEKLAQRFDILWCEQVVVTIRP